MTFDTIEYSVEQDIATIRLNRPEKMNSINLAMHEDLRNALKEVKRDKAIRCLVFTGNGKAFSAGQDLMDRYKLVNSPDTPDLGASLQKQYNPLIETIVSLDIPVICAVNGLAAGAGVGIALACDVVVAARSAKFGFAFAKVGLVPDSGCSWSLIQAVGLPRARAMVMMGETISAEEAAEVGMIWRCVEDDQLDSEVKTVIEKLLSNPSVGLGLSKRALNAAVVNSLTDQLTMEAKLQTLAGRTDDYAEAVRSFVEKRPPKFTDS